MGKVVEGDVSGVTDAIGATTSYDISRINTTSELETALGIDVEASGGGGLSALRAVSPLPRNRRFRVVRSS